VAPFFLPPVVSETPNPSPDPSISMAPRPKKGSIFSGERVEGTSTLASAYSDLNVALWSKLNDDDDFSQLRKKFWGKTIEEEAKHWRESHPTMNVDDTNDIGAECYGLDLGIIGIKNSRLWVRQDYQDI